MANIANPCVKPAVVSPQTASAAILLRRKRGAMLEIKIGPIRTPSVKHAKAIENTMDVMAALTSK